MNWRTLRGAGNLKVLKVSYILLLIIPILTTHNTVTTWLGFKPWLLGCTFFASLFLALANLIYDTSCPEIVKRFQSTNDLYVIMLEIRRNSIHLYPDDNYEASLEHCSRAYENASTSKPFRRAICQISFFLSGIFTSIIFINRSYIVIASLFSSC